MSKHTPGPWYVGCEDEDTGEIEVISGVRPYVCLVLPGAIDDVTPANARLIAAAPDLLIELRQAVIQMEMAAECIENKRYDEALLHVSSLMRSKRAAITKATGK